MKLEYTAFELASCLEAKTAKTGKYSPFWTADWNEIKDKKSMLGDFALQDDTWDLDPKLFSGVQAIETHKNLRQIKFKILDEADFSDLSGVTRRLKRILWIGLHSVPGKVSTLVQKGNLVLKLAAELPPIIASQTRSPSDPCPDGFKLFSDLEPASYETHLPEGFVPRDAYHFLVELVDLIDDNFDFLPKTYSDYINQKNRDKGDAKIVKNRAYTDEEASKILDQAMYWSSLVPLVDFYDDWAKPHIAEAKELWARGNNTYGEWGVFRYQDSKNTLAPSHTLKAEEIFNNDFAIPAEQMLKQKGLLNGNNSFRYHIGTGNQKAASVFEYGLRTNTNLVTLIELSHRILIAYFTGMRPQDLHALPYDVLEEKWDDNYTVITGYNIKGSDTIGGDLRQYPLPDQCVEFIKLQQHISSRYFGQTDTLFNLERGYHSLLNSTFGPQADLSDTSNIIRRQRPTVAATVMMASRSPMAGMTVLGQDTVEQFLGYAKSYGDLHKEILEQDEIVNRALGRKIWDDVSSGSAPEKLTRRTLESAARFVGLNEEAERVRNAVTKLKITDYTNVLRLAGEEADQVEEYIGKQFDFVAPDIVCGAMSGKFKGACSAKDGIKNPSNCQSSCRHRYSLQKDLTLRQEMAEDLLDDLSEMSEPTDPAFYFKVNDLLDCIYSFEGPLEDYKNDLRVQGVVMALRDADGGNDIMKKLKPTSKLALKDIEGVAA